MLWKRVFQKNFGEVKKDLISVIIINFNTGICLKDCLQAVFSNSSPFEIIIVDNASTDKCIDVLKEQESLGNLTVIWNKENVGFAKACNQALLKTKGEYILFLNPDCIMQADTLKLLKDILSQNKDVGMVGPFIVNTDGSEQVGARRKIPTPWHSLMQTTGLGYFFPNHDFRLNKTPLPTEPIEVGAISGAFMLVKQQALQQVGPLDENYFLHCEDLDIAMRFQQAGWRILFVPHAKALHHKGVGSKGRSIPVLWHTHLGMLRFYKKFFQHKYPLPIMWLVYLGVWLRLIAIVTIKLLRYDFKSHKSFKLR